MNSVFFSDIILIFCTACSVYQWSFFYQLLCILIFSSFINLLHEMNYYSITICNKYPTLLSMFMISITHQFKVMKKTIDIRKVLEIRKCLQDMIGKRSIFVCMQCTSFYIFNVNYIPKICICNMVFFLVVQFKVHLHIDVWCKNYFAKKSIYYS